MGTPNYPAADVPDYDDDGDTGLEPDDSVFEAYAAELDEAAAAFGDEAAS